MAQMMPYILPLLLGRTFDLDRMQVGIDIFPKEVLDRKVVIRNPSSETHYKIVDNMMEARDLIDVGGSFSLNVKSGIFKAGVSGEYLSDTYNRENTVEVAVRATYQTVTEQLSADARPIATWRSLGAALGTHFVRSITYGGEVIATVRMECNSTKDKRKIKGALDVGGRVELFDMGIEVEGEYMKDLSKSVDSTQIKIFSSIPLSRPPNDMESLKKMLDGFPDDIKQFNEGMGIPLKMELWPLSFLDPTRPGYMRNSVLEAALDEFEQKFDDLLNTKTAITDWMKVMVKPLTDEQESKVGSLYEQVEKVIQTFYEVIGSLNMAKGTDQLRKAGDDYGSVIPGVFYKKYQLLRQEIAKDQGDWTRSKAKGITYTHWGKSNCSAVDEQLSRGIVAGPESSGGGANFLCLREVPDSEYFSVDRKDAAVVKGASFEYPGQQRSLLVCSTCHLSTKSSVEVFSGRSTCPNAWDYIYDGLIMSGSRNTTHTEVVCLDKTAEKTSSDVVLEHPLLSNWASLLKKQGTEAGMLFPCVVCAK